MIVIRDIRPQLKRLSEQLNTQNEVDHLRVARVARELEAVLQGADNGTLAYLFARALETLLTQAADEDALTFVSDEPPNDEGAS